MEMFLSAGSTLLPVRSGLMRRSFPADNLAQVSPTGYRGIGVLPEGASEAASCADPSRQILLDHPATIVTALFRSSRIGFR